MNLGFLDKALDGLERNVVETLQQAAARTLEFEGEFPTQSQRPRGTGLHPLPATAASDDALSYWEAFRSQVSWPPSWYTGAVEAVFELSRHSRDIVESQHAQHALEPSLVSLAVCVQR